MYHLFSYPKLLCSFAVVLILLGGACSYDSAELSQVRCQDEGQVQGTQTCQDGFWTVGDDLDAGAIDADQPDADQPDAVSDVEEDIEEDVCNPVTETDYCSDMGYECGTHSADDGCGDTVSFTCGSCGGETPFCSPDSECVGCDDQTGEEVCATLDAQCETTQSACDGTLELNFCDDCAEVIDVVVTDSEPCCVGGQACSCDTEERTYEFCLEDDCSQVTLTVEEEANCSDCTNDCSDWSECIPLTSCEPQGQRTRSCTEWTCEEGATECEPTSTQTTEEDFCDAGNQDGLACELQPFASCSSPVQSTCESGTCSIPCAGDKGSCGCSSCSDCGDQDGRYFLSTQSCPDQIAPGQDCFELENRFYDCSEQQCVSTQTGTASNIDLSSCTSTGACEPQTPGQCSSDGIQAHTCDVWVCDDANQPCEEQSRTIYFTCTLNPDGSSCTGGVGACHSGGTCDGTTCEPVDRCSGSDGDCGCESCQDCTELPDDWRVVEDSPCCRDDQHAAHATPCRCVTEERYVAECSANECVYVGTNETRETVSGCGDNCGGGGQCIIAGDDACCVATGSGDVSCG